MRSAATRQLGPDKSPSGVSTYLLATCRHAVLESASRCEQYLGPNIRACQSRGAYSQRPSIGLSDIPSSFPTRLHGPAVVMLISAQ